VLPNARITNLPGVTHLAPFTHPAMAAATMIAEFVSSTKG